MMKQDYNHIYDLCKNHMHAYVLVELANGAKIDGIVTGLDEEYVYFAVPLDGGNETYERFERTSNRPFGGWGGYGSGYGPGHPGHGYHQGYGRPRPRFRRLVLPLAALAALSILPWY